MTKISTGAGHNIGLIGLGKMGQPMAHNLLRAGFNLRVYDVADAPVQELSSVGAQPASSPRDVVQHCNLVILSLPDVPTLRSVVRSQNGLLSADVHDKIVIDTTTSTMHASVELAAEVAGQGGQMLDAPVTGGVWGAQNATLRFFVGGDKAAFDRAQDVFGTLGKLAVYIGPSGHGQIGKMVCQMIGSVEYAVAAEALALAESVGADTRSIAQVLGERHVMQRMIDLRDSGNLGSEGYTAQRGKDIDYAVEEAMRNGSEIPVTRAVKTVFDAARAQGLGDCDPLALYRLWQEGYHH